MEEEDQNHAFLTTLMKKNVSISDWIRELLVPRISVHFVSKEDILLSDIDP
jgi:hypothetical protein